MDWMVDPYMKIVRAYFAIYISMLILGMLLSLLLDPEIILAAGNETNDSYNRAKKMLEREVYFDHRVTIYCEAEFDERKNTDLPAGFEPPSHPKRSDRVEWEHAVPVENFGRAFPEWRDGSPECIDNRGKAFKGRKCAEKANMTFRYMQSDMHNLFPAIGSVNAVRGNKQYSELEGDGDFGLCTAKVNGNHFEPPDHAKVQLARAALYLAREYPQYRLSAQQRLFEAWDRKFAPDEWECRRAARIERLQGNANIFVKERCGPRLAR